MYNVLNLDHSTFSSGIWRSDKVVLVRSVEARITTHQHERQALVAQLRDIRRTAERLLLALVGRAEPPRGRGRPRTKDATAGAKRTVSAATRMKMVAAAKKRWAAKRKPVGVA